VYNYLLSVENPTQDQIFYINSYRVKQHFYNLTVYSKNLLKQVEGISTKPTIDTEGAIRD